MTETVLTACIAFLTTNLDDLFLLALLFSGAETLRQRRAVVLGQLMGIFLLTAVSVFAAAAARRWLMPYVHWMGLLPIILGVRGFLLLRRADTDDPPPALSAGSVMLLTVANGGDNLGVYIPLFAGRDFSVQLIIACIFLLMTLLWCVLARLPALLLPHGITLHRVGRYMTPPVLILLGVWVLLQGFFA